jgi:hypothetical protein
VQRREDRGRSVRAGQPRRAVLRWAYSAEGRAATVCRPEV